jgi:3-methylcrotonyl-CoA carboxylase alpha subunit
VGVANNVEFLRRLVTSPSFAEVRLDTSLIEREHEWVTAKQADVPDAAVVIAALALVLREANSADQEQSPWAVRDGWRLNSVYQRIIRFVVGERSATATIEYGGSTYQITAGDQQFEVSGELRDEVAVDGVIDGTRVQATVVLNGNQHHVFLDGAHVAFVLDDPLDTEAQHHAGEGSLLAPMPGRVVALIAKPGDRVEKGAPLMVLEAMKMECTIHAPAAGHVASFHYAAGDQVSEGVELLHFEREDAGENGNG